MAFSCGALAVMATFIAGIFSLQFMDSMTTKTLHITHYTHEIRGGPNNSVIVVGENHQPNSTNVGFGTIVVYDNMMRAGIEPDSKLLGRVSGTGVGIVRPGSVANHSTRLQIIMQHIFTEGSEYNGSTIDIIGIFVFNPPTEMLVAGATGQLSGYSGYGILQPISEDTGPPPLRLVYQWDFYLTKKKQVLGMGVLF